MNKCVIIPVIFKPCAWEKHPFAKFQVVPDKGKPVSSHADQEAAWAEVVKAVETVCRLSETQVDATILKTETRQR